jgi:FkbM family methyltransferase
MKNKIGLLFRFIIRLGIINGTLIFFKVHLTKRISFRISKIKHKILLRKNTSDLPTFVQVFIDKEYEIELPLTPVNIIDGGANIGMASIYFKNKYPNAKIVAIEPDDDNFIFLNENTKNYDNIKVLRSALWNKKTDVSVSDKLNIGKWGMMVEESDAPQGLISVTVDEIIQAENWSYVDLLKLDIEGAELALFSDNYESWLPKCRIIIIELHDKMVKNTAMNFFNALNRCNINYSMSISGENIVIVNDNLIKE